MNSEADSPLSDREANYLLEEYKALRVSIEADTERNFRLERGAFGALVVIYGLIFSDSFLISSEFETWVWFAPPFVSLFSLRRTFLHRVFIESISEYIRANIEPIIGPKAGGWEQERFAASQRKGRYFSTDYRPSKLWLLIFLATAAAALTKVLGFH